MSKNLRGLSGSSVTIDLLDIDANSVTATTGTFTDIIATNYSINNVAINNLIVSGVVRLTGIVDAPVTLLPEYEILFKDPYNNLVYKFSSLVFNTTSGTLKSPDIITATMTVGDITVTGILTLMGSMPALQVTGQTDLGTGLSIQSLASVASNSVHPLTLWNSTTKNISQDNTKLYYDTTTDTLYSPKISVTDFNIVPVTRSDDVEYPVVFFDDNTDNLATDSVASAFRYNPSTNRLTLQECKVTGKVICDVLAITKEIVTGTDSQVKFFIEDGFNFKIDDTTNIEGFYFFSGVTEWMRIAVGETRIATDVEIAGDATLESSLTVESGTFLGSSLHVDALDPVVANTSYAVLLWDITSGAGNRSVTYDFTNFYYDTTTDTLHVPNISATIPDLQIVPVTRSDDVDYKVVFFDDNTDNLAVDSVSSAFTFNPSANKLKTIHVDILYDLTAGRDTFLGGRLYVNNINPVQSGATYGEQYPLIVWHKNATSGTKDVAQDFQNLYYDTTTNTLHVPNISLTDATMAGETTITAFNALATPVNINCRLLFLEGNTLTGRISGNGCYYNPSGDVLFANRLQGSVHSRSPEFLISYTGHGNGQIKQVVHTDTNIYLQYQQTNGHLLRTSTGPKLLITNSLSTIYTPFRCDGDCTIEYKPALASENRDMRVVVSDVGATDKTIKQHNQFTFNPSTTLLSVPNIDATGTVTAGTLDVTNNMTVSALTLNSVPTVPSTSNTDILLLDLATNQISKSGLTFNASGGVLSTANITLTGALSAAFVNTTSDATIGGNLGVANNLTVSGTSTCGNINFGNLDSTNAAAKITVQQPIHYGAGAFAQPLNYTIKIGTTDSIRTIDTVSGTGFNSGKFGNGVTLSILRSGVKTTSYGQNSEIISWNPYIDATNTATNFTLGGLPGLWDIRMTCKYTSSSLGSSNRVSPIVRAVLNNTTTVDGGDQSMYIRHQFGRVATIVWHNKIYLNTSDSIRFDTYANYAGTITYTSLIASDAFDLSDFMFIATFLGPLDEYDKTPA